MSSSDEEQWIVVTTGNWTTKPVYYGETRQNPLKGGRTEFPGNAYRYPSENAALAAGYEAKQTKLIGDFQVQKLPPKPRFKAPGESREGNG